MVLSEQELQGLDAREYGGSVVAFNPAQNVDIVCAPSYLSNGFASRTHFRALFDASRFQLGIVKAFSGARRHFQIERTI